MVGSSIGPYLVVERLGAGGMGEVYLAFDTRLNRKVALKSLGTASAAEPGTHDRLLREARAAAGLAHPNIAAIHDIFETGSRPCIVMEYVQGESLAARVGRGPLPCEQALSIGIQLADALTHAHAAGVIHRDLKPANVMLGPDGTAKVLDFGLAKTRDLETDPPPDGLTHEAARSQSGKISGTPAYMAPEQLLGSQATPQSDIYSLGVLLFELLTGHRPFAETDFVGLALSIVSGPVPTVDAVAPGVPSEVSVAVARAMARDPARRFQSAEALGTELRRLQRTLCEQPTTTGRVPTLVARAPRAFRVVPETRRGRAAAVAGGVLVLVALAWVGTTLWRGRDATGSLPGPAAPPIVGVLPLDNLSGNPLMDHVGIGISAALEASLAAIPALTVISGNETRRYLGRGGDLRKIARDLGATLLVNGSVLQAGPDLRFLLEVLKADGAVAWAEHFEGPQGELIQLQRRAADALVAALRVSVTPAARQRLDRLPTSSVDAYTDYSIGKALLDRSDVSGNVGRAVQVFERAVSKDHGFALAYAGLGEACWASYQSTKDKAWVGRATQAIEEAIRLDPGNPEIRVSLAGVFLGTGKTAEAIAALRHAIAQRPNDDQAHRLLAGALAEKGSAEEALGEYQSAIAIRPDYYANHQALGNFYFRSGRLAEAAIAYQRATEVQPDSPNGFINLGATYQMLGDNQRALENYQRALTFGPDETAYSNIGAIHHSEGRYADAIRAYGDAIELAPRNAITHRNLGDAYQRLGRRDQAVAEYRRAASLATEELAVNPRDARLLAERAVYEAKAGDIASAVRDSRAAVGLSPRDNDVLYRRAVVHALAGQTAEAVEWLERALARGCPRARAREDEDLEPIRGLAKVKAMLEAAR